MRHSPSSLKARASVFFDLCAVVATLGGVLWMEFVQGVLPCHLCYEERWPWYGALVLLAVAWASWHRLHHGVRVALLSLVALTFVGSAFFGLYHAGVEAGWWPGPSTCTGSGAAATGGNLMDALNHLQVVPCDKATVLILALSLAAWNGIVSAFLAVHAVVTIRAMGQGRVYDASNAIAAATVHGQAR